MIDELTINQRAVHDTVVLHASEETNNCYWSCTCGQSSKVSPTSALGAKFEGAKKHLAWHAENPRP